MMITICILHLQLTYQLLIYLVTCTNYHTQICILSVNMLMTSASIYKRYISVTISKSKDYSSSHLTTSKSCIHLKWYTSFNLIRHVLAEHEYECTSTWKNQISWYLPRIMYNPLKTYIGQYSRETEPRSIMNTDMNLLYMWGPIYICQPLILICLVIHGLMPPPPSSQCLQKLKPWMLQTTIL